MNTFNVELKKDTSFILLKESLYIKLKHYIHNKTYT